MAISSAAVGVVLKVPIIPMHAVLYNCNFNLILLYYYSAKIIVLCLLPISNTDSTGPFNDCNVCQVSVTTMVIIYSVINVLET
jgi:hypothetical protein